MYMDDIKLFAKNEKESETLINAVRIYSQDLGMELGIEKCALQVMKSSKRHLTDGMEQPNQDKIRTLGEKKSNTYVKILEADTIKQEEMKEKVKKEYFRRIRKLLETKLLQQPYQRNKYQGCPARKIFVNILEVDPRRIKTNGPETKKTNDITSQKWRWQIICVENNRKSGDHPNYSFI